MKDFSPSEGTISSKFFTSNASKQNSANHTWSKWEANRFSADN